MKKNLAIVTDQLTGGIGGAESILFSLYEIFPEAPTYTTVYNKDIMPEEFRHREVFTSLIQNLPFAKRFYKSYFPLMPFAVEFLDLQNYDIVFSSHHSVAKGIIPRPDAVHICYCHSPARYIWDLFWFYSKSKKFTRLKKILTSIIFQYMRVWDATSANRVDYFLANSRYTAARIKKFYNRNSEILHPPVNTEKFNHEDTYDYYLMIGRLVSYKGYELAIEAFNETGKKLVIIGDGVEFSSLKAKAGKNVFMTGRINDRELVKYMNNCRGLVFPGKEDFGIVMAEAQAAGKPVIAYKAGGALDIVLDMETGVFFKEQTADSLNAAIRRTESVKWDHRHIKNYSKKFDKRIFTGRITEIIENAEFLDEALIRAETSSSRYINGFRDVLNEQILVNS